VKTAKQYVHYNNALFPKHAWVGWKRPRNMIDATKYRQMAGRAGRAGIDTAGEAILLASRDNMPALQLRELMVVSMKSVVRKQLAGSTV
jgi:replicative superfamily II helicase